MKTTAEINPVPRLVEIELSELKKATASDLNREVDGKKEKAIGKTIYANFGTRSSPMIRKVKLTGDRYQTEWVKDFLGWGRIYVEA